jgi:DNA (cytosine-5)-methyltransferase 1
MSKLKLLDLFSGIGGFSLGLERSGGFETVAFCEIEDYPRRVLAKHWPEVPCYDDIRTLTAERLAADGIAVDAISAGFPCQDISHAGKQGGIDAERSGLWSQVVRLVGELQPRLLLLENVSALLSGPSTRAGAWFGRVLGDLAALGYDAEWESIRAGTIGLPQNRDRVWVLAYPHKVGRNAPVIETALPNKAGAFREWEQVELCGTRRGNTRFVPSSRIIRMGDGLPSEVDRSRVECCGNAVVPQIPELLGRAWMEANQ